MNRAGAASAYHGSISGRPSTMSHTYNLEVFSAARVNGREVGALSLHPDESCRQIAAGAKAALERVAAGEVPLPGISRPATLDLEFQTADMAEVATWVRGATRTAERAVQIEGEDLLAIFTSFVALNDLTRQAGGR